MKKKIRRNLILAIEYSALISAVSLIAYSVYYSRWEVIAACLAVIAAIIANFNSQKISWKQEDEYEADVDVIFDLKTISKMVLLVIENVGGSRAYDIEFSIDPPLKIINYDDIKSFSISYIETKERVQYYVDGSENMFKENLDNKRPLEYNVKFSFSQTKKGKKIIKTKRISIEPFRRTTSPDSDYEKFILNNSRITEKLDKIEKAITNLSK